MNLSPSLASQNPPPSSEGGKGVMVKMSVEMQVSDINVP